MVDREALHRIYAEVPTIDCKGHCHVHCTKWMAAEGEFIELTRITGTAPRQDPKTGSCNLLIDKRCAAYDDRPYICRAYGVAEGVLCPFGCVPEKTLTRMESASLIARIYKLFGSTRFYTN